MQDMQRYARTPRGWEALARPDLRGSQTHTLLLLANGRRSEQELILLLGTEVTELLQRLQQQGYLQQAQMAQAPDDDIVAGA